MTSYPMKWQSMSWPIKDLMLFDGILEAFKSICNSLNFPILLMNELTGATFANVNEVKKSFYQDNIIPEGVAFIQELNKFLHLPERKLLLKPDFSHIEVIQKDKKVEAQRNGIISATINKIILAFRQGNYNEAGAQFMLVKYAGVSPKEAKILTNVEMIENEGQEINQG